VSLYLNRNLFFSEINALRRELKLLKQSQKEKELVFITRRQINTSPYDQKSKTSGGSSTKVL
jgi:hypothetical protein